MKKFIVLCLVCCSCLTGCYNTTNNTKDGNNISQANNVQKPSVSSISETKKDINNESEQKSYSFFGHYQMTDDFAKVIDKNPIDSDHEKELHEFSYSKDFNTQGWVALESKYSQIWDTELNVIYKKLLSKLNDSEQKILKEAQKGWVQFYINEPKFVNEVFYFRKTGQIFGTQGSVQMVQARNRRLRQRTLELMEYYKMLGNEVEFQYQSGLK